MNAEDHEILEVVDKEGNVLGLAARSVLHADPSLIHRVVHVLVFNDNGELLLQRRSMNKDVAPGMWDTSVGGHISPGEDPPAAARREMREELGIEGPDELEFLYTYLFTNHRESELVSTFRYICNSGFSINRDEIDEVRYWSLDEIRKGLGCNLFSRHFEQEIRTYLGIY
ncbi:MAG: NUDIX domain-containing protein [Nitrospirae bacterium]|nr:MAG: NUDIX domain-containing protein [Nitrospirota bacterium]